MRMRGGLCPFPVHSVPLNSVLRKRESNDQQGSTGNALCLVAVMGTGGPLFVYLPVFSLKLQGVTSKEQRSCDVQKAPIAAFNACV